MPDTSILLGARGFHTLTLGSACAALSDSVRVPQVPERTVQSRFVQDGLTLGDRPTPPGPIETVVVPRAREAPQLPKIKDRARLHVTALGPRLDVVFRPEEQYRASGEADVAPPVARRNREVDDPWGIGQRPIGDGDNQR